MLRMVGKLHGCAAKLRSGLFFLHFKVERSKSRGEASGFGRSFGYAQDDKFAGCIGERSRLARYPSFAKGNPARGGKNLTVLCVENFLDAPKVIFGVDADGIELGLRDVERHAVFEQPQLFEAFGLL